MTGAAVKPFRPLTPAQARVCRGLAGGGSYATVALKLGISPRTVKVHVHAIADLLPDDGLHPKERVQIWAILAGYQNNTQPEHEEIKAA